jgi:hypothetical protein
MIVKQAFRCELATTRRQANAKVGFSRYREQGLDDR